MVQCLLVNKIVFIGLENWTYTHITVKGKGIVVNELTRQEAKELVKEQNLKLATPDEYADYNSRYGKIYTDGRFKKYLDKYQKTKRNLLSILEKMDEE